MRLPQPEIVHLRPENTGGIEMSFQRKMIGIPHPHVPESHEKPLRAEIETLIWNNPDSEAKPGEKVQYVVMGGMNANAVEVHPILAMLTNHADTVVGVAHPDAPPSRIVPHDSPFNDERSFANSGYTVLRTIEKLYEEGALDRKSPLAVVGFSTGAAVLTEAIGQDIREAQNSKAPRLVNQAVLLSPGGMLEIGEKEIMKGIGKTGSLYWQEYFDTYMPEAYRLDGTLDEKFIVKTLLTDALSEFRIQDWLMDMWNLAKSFKNVLELAQNWQRNREWLAAIPGHMLIGGIEVLAKTIPGERMKQLLAHWHRMWIDQPGWPHWSPETPAFKRSRQNVAHDVTQRAREATVETPMILWFGQNDKAIAPTKFLTQEDWKAIGAASGPNDAIELQNDLIVRRIRESFPNNRDNLHILFAQGDRSHHLSPRSNASALELYLLRYLYPEKMPERRVYTGSSE